MQTGHTDFPLEMSHMSTFGPISSWRNEESQKIEL
jgi:hypothetical protein